MAENRERPLEDVIERAINEIDGEKITFGDVLDLFGDRSFGPIIMLLGLLVVLPPLGAIPGLPVIVGFVIILFSAQIVFGAHHIWVPRFIEKQSIPKDKLKAADEKAKPWLARIDNLVSERLSFLTGKVSTVIAAACVTGLSLTMIPLEVVPFAVGVPGATIALFGLAFVARDGVLMLLGYAATTIAVLFTIFVVPWGQFASWLGMGGG